MVSHSQVPNSVIATLAIMLIALPTVVQSIQCYSGSQLQILECPSISCIKQTLGLDTVRYCDGTGVSSICQTYRIFDTCQNIPNLGYICCCSDSLCNSAEGVVGRGLVTTLLSTLALIGITRWVL